MRVASVNQDPGIAPGRKKGAAVHVEAMRRALRGRGVQVVAVDDPDPETVARSLEGAWRRAPLDLVYERLALGGTAGVEFAERRGVPLVVELNAPLIEEARRWRRAERIEELVAAEKRVLAGATAVIAVSASVARYAVEHGADPARVSVHPNGVDTRLFQPGSSLRAELVPEGRFVLGFHGRLRPWHGFERLVSATRQLLDRGEPVHLLVVGEGDFELDLRDQLPCDHVTRVGWIEHQGVGRYVASFDVLPLTYAPDLPCYFSPLKLAEAMACGVVPIVPDLGDLAGQVEHGVNGLVYSATDPDALVQTIAGLMRDPASKQALSVGACDAARVRSWDRIADFVLGHARPSREASA